LTRAASKRGQLSFRDHLCLIVASDASFSPLQHAGTPRVGAAIRGDSAWWTLTV
jgi:hypothetical protein